MIFDPITHIYKFITKLRSFTQISKFKAPKFNYLEENKNTAITKTSRKATCPGFPWKILN